MNKLFKNHFFVFAFLIFICYCIAEIIIRGEALNRISCGIAGWLFWGGIVYLVFVVLILPIMQFVTFPAWKNPDEISDSIQRYHFLQRYANFLISHFRENPPSSIKDLIKELNNVVRMTQGDSVRFCKMVKPLVIQIHETLSEDVCQGIIRDYMHRTALIVMVSQRGWVDSSAMLIMQIRLIIDLSKALGQRPTWISFTACLFWVTVNSFFFAIFDGTEFVDEAIKELSIMILGEEYAKATPILGKATGIAFQGVASMAIIYATGKAIQKYLLDRQNRMTGKERIKNRIDGYRKGCNEVLSMGKTMIFQRN